MLDIAADQVKPYLNHIADRLWSNNATVMVGAGFSRNAKPIGSTSASFPDWRELGDIFYEKLHGRSPSGDVRYLNPLKLAEQIRAAFGDPALEALLRRAIPDLSYEPSLLHVQLLDLPWKDVFTTNYDTLFERARASVPLRRYDVVATDKDLLYANQPRIVKLHGSFPSPPFVITEEDYRRYPNEHAPFVNTVRQSLLENTLCLIGFSGDDPNFLQWVGWIRDHLGQETAPKIYLIGVFGALTGAERRLLDRRGIVVIDLSMFDADHGTALGAFFSYLKSRKPSAAAWPTVSADAASWVREASSEKYADIAAEWRRQRVEYPGWIVTPEDKRQHLWFLTERWLSHFSRISPKDRAALKTPLDLDLAFELAWRLDRCLFPLMGELPAFLEEVATKYSNAKLHKAGWSEPSVFEAVANIRLWLLRHYREEGLIEKWQEVRRAFKVNSGKLLPEHRVRLRLEEALQALFRFDPAETKRLLVDWQSDAALPFWEAKRAALMAELGETAAARSILETSLSAVRRQLGLNPIITDYTLVSQESVVMHLLWSLQQGRPLGEVDSEDGNLQDELSERRSELTRYRCDPQNEIALLSEGLKNRPERWRQGSKTPGFDLRTFSRTFRFHYDKEAIAAYGLLRMYEDIGMPYRMEHTRFLRIPIESIPLRIRRYSPHWALASIVRLGDARATDGLFDREYLAGLKRDDVDSLFDIYMPAFERTIAMVNEPDRSEAKTFELLAKTLPEVFSRLCYKCSANSRERMIGALHRIYASKRRQMFVDVGLFARRLFRSMTIEERVCAVPTLIDFPVPDRWRAVEEREFINPLLLIDLPISVRQEANLVTAERIDDLLDCTAPGIQHRDWTMTSLVWLHKQGQLNKQQSERLGEVLWYGVDTPFVPVVAGTYTIDFMTLPHPVEINPEPRVKERLRTMIDNHMKSNRFDDVLDELHLSVEVVEWSRAEALELVATFSGWWNRNKKWLHNQWLIPFRSPEDIKYTAWKAVVALSSVFSKLSADHDAGNAKALFEFLEDLMADDIPTKVLEAATLSMLAEGRDQTSKRVAAAMLDNDHGVVVDALSAARVLAGAFEKDEMRGKFAPVGAMLVQGVQWRHRPALTDRLRVVADLIKNHPWFLSEVALTDLLAGLDKIAKETSCGIRGNDQDGVILVRAAAAELAFVLCGYLRKSESDEPEAIRRWRVICNDPDEFSEVKNAWRVSGVPRTEPSSRGSSVASEGVVPD